METLKCPKCNTVVMNDHLRTALSRKDNKTKICRDCGIKEAIEDMFKDAGFEGEDLEKLTTSFYGKNIEPVLIKLERQKSEVNKKGGQRLCVRR